MTGTVTYSADLTYTADSTISGNIAVTLPASCLTVNGITVTCTQLTQALMNMADPSFASASCVAAGSGCTCTVPEPAQTTNETGTYTTTSAGLLTQSPANGTADLSDYCVKGSALTESPHPGSSMMGQSVSGVITLARQ
jgi:hypothetical protein